MPKTGRSQNSKDSIGAYAVQCGKCFKWRLIPTVEEYEAIRERFIEDPWYCDKDPNVSCDVPGDLEYDTSRLWVIDKPNIPKTPPEFERGLALRKDFSKFDAYYVVPNGKKVRAPAEVEKFLESCPEYKDKVSVSSFNFAVPKIMEDMVPRNAEWKASASTKKRMRTSKTEDN